VTRLNEVISGHDPKRTLIGVLGLRPK
jgi:hypothetical protein